VGERVLTSQQNQDFVSLMAGMVGAQISQVGAMSDIAAALGNISVSTAQTADNTAGTFAGIQGMTGSLGSIVNNALSIAGGGMVALGAGNLGLGFAAGKGIHGLLTSLGIGPAPDLGMKGTGLFGPYFDPNTLPSGYGPSDPWGIFQSYDEGGEVDVGGLANVHAGEYVLSVPERREVSGRLARLEKAASVNAGQVNHFHLHVDGVLAGENVSDWWARMKIQYDNQFGSASQDLIQSVAKAGIAGI